MEHDKPLTLIVPFAADRQEYEQVMPYLFNFAEDGISLCIKSIQGLELSKFQHIYFVLLGKLARRYNLSELLEIQLRKLNLANARIVMLEQPTSSQAETVYQCIRQKQITGSVFIKDPDGFFACDFTQTNGIAIYPLDKLDLVSPQNKSYVAVDDQFYITNIIENKIVSRYFNAGGYLFEDAETYCRYYSTLHGYGQIYLSHIVYAMLLDKIPFRPFEAKDYRDWGNRKLYLYYSHGYE